MQTCNTHHKLPFWNKIALKVLFIAVSLVCICTSLQAQQYSESADVYFTQGNSAWNPNFMNNGRVLNGFIEKIRNYMNDSSYVVLGIDYFSYASPEGTILLNEKIANNRERAISGYLHKRIQFRDDQVRVFNVNEDWDYLEDQVALLPVPYKQQVFDVIDTTTADDTREQALMQVGGGKAWNYMMANIFPKMRKVMLVVHVGIPEPEVSLLTTDIENLKIEVPADDAPLHFNVEKLHADAFAPPVVVPKHWYLKTNVAALGLMVANLAIERDLGGGFSFAFPVYYSGCNYFSSRTKFRTLTIQPELRYWFNRSYYNFYCGVHAGLGWYNIATGNGWRIQDKGGSSPAVGAGIAAGYRTPQLGNRWHIEFALGAGVYTAEYDKFHNEPNGQLYATCKKTYVGLDQASINLVYKLGCKNRRGEK